MPVIAVINSKGGVGKTAAAINLAAASANAGVNTLLIDHDPRQGSSARWKQKADEQGRDELPVIVVESGIVKAVNDFKPSYPMIVIDGPAYLDNANTALIACADIVVLPIQPSQPDIWAVETALRWIAERQEMTGGYPLAYVLLSRAHPDERVDTLEVEDIKQLGLPVLGTRMVNRVNYSRTYRRGTTVFSLPANDKARQEIQAIYEELL